MGEEVEGRSRGTTVLSYKVGRGWCWERLKERDLRNWERFKYLWSYNGGKIVIYRYQNVHLEQWTGGTSKQ